MKTIAITIDEPTLESLDRFLAANPEGANRSKVVRQAIEEFLERRALQERERKEWRIWAAKLKRINAQAAALVEEQGQ